MLKKLWPPCSWLLTAGLRELTQHVWEFPKVSVGLHRRFWGPWPSQTFPHVSSCAACGKQPRGRAGPGGAWRQRPPASCQAGHSSDKGQLFGGVVVLLGAPNPWNNCCHKHSNHLQGDRHIGAFQVQGSQPPPQPLFSSLFKNFQKQDGELEAQALGELSGAVVTLRCFWKCYF